MSRRAEYRAPLERDRERIADGHYDDPPMPVVLMDLEELVKLPLESQVRGKDRPLKLTANQRLRIKRDCCIKAAAMAGLSQSVLESVFGLGHSAIVSIVGGRANYNLDRSRRAQRDGHADDRDGDA